MSMYEAYRRSNEYDQPKPVAPGYEWTVTATGAPMYGISFPDNEQGCKAAHNFAMHLNTAYQRGFAKSQNNLREALGLDAI